MHPTPSKHPSKMPRGRKPDPEVAARKAAEAERLANMTQEQIAEEKSVKQKRLSLEREEKKAKKDANHARFKKMAEEMRERHANMTEEERKQMNAKKAEKSKSTRKRLQGDLIFPVKRMKGHLRRQLGLRRIKKAGEKERTKVTMDAAIFSTAVIEYLTAEVLELAGECTKQMKKGRIVPRHILSAIRMDDELNKLFPKNTTISSAGVMPKAIPGFLKNNNVPRKEFTMSAYDMFKPTAVSTSSLEKKNTKSVKYSVMKGEVSGDVNNNK